jgi:hypothetical protein
VRVALKKLDGVASCEVSWGRRVAEVRFSPGSTATVGALRRLIRFAHLLPREAQVVAQGVLREEQGVRALLLESGEVFRLQGEKVPGAAGQRVEVRGTLSSDPVRANPAGDVLVLEVAEAKALP